MAVDPRLLIFTDEFVPNIQTAPYHAKWVKANPGEAARWAAFRDALLAGKTAAIPDMTTKYGRALVAAGKDHMTISEMIGGTLPPISWRGPQTITAGGTYTDNWEATGSTPAILIQTTDPVTISGRVRNLDGNGPLIQYDIYGIQLTVENLIAEGRPFVRPTDADTGWDTPYGRFIELVNHRSLTVQNCTVIHTRGIELSEYSTTYYDGSDVLISKVRHLYPTGGRHLSEPVGNFLQLIWMQHMSACDVEWCEVIQEFDQAFTEDTISLFHSGGQAPYVGATISDLMLWHQSYPLNLDGSGEPNLQYSSQGGITIDGSDAGPGSFNNTIQRCQIVDGYGIVIYCNVAGDNNLVDDCRIVCDGYLSDGRKTENSWSSPLWIIDGGPGTNNHCTNNYVSYVDRDGTQPNDDYDGTQTHAEHALNGSPDGGTAEAALNTFVDDPTSADEDAEWTLWQNKLTTNDITIGAPGA